MYAIAMLEVKITSYWSVDHPLFKVYRPHFYEKRAGWVINVVSHRHLEVYRTVVVLSICNCQLGPEVSGSFPGSCSSPNRHCCKDIVSNTCIKQAFTTKKRSIPPVPSPPRPLLASLGSPFSRPNYWYTPCAPSTRRSNSRLNPLTEPQVPARLGEVSQPDFCS